jgi:hypothetical protein
MTSHHWGGPFQYFADVEQAAYEIGEFCKRWGRISVGQTKEKYGTSRVYCSFGIHQLFCITHPGYAYSRYPVWFWKFDCYVIAKLFHLIRLNAIVVPWQLYIYRLGYKKALKKYPHIRREILAYADWPEHLVGVDSKLEEIFYQ